MTENIAAFFETLGATLPPWAAATVILALAILAAWLVHRVVFRVLTRIASGKELLQRALVSRTRGPLLLGAIILALMLVSPIAPLDEGASAVLRRVLLIGFIVLLAWVASTALHIWMTVHLRRFKLDTEDNLLARKHVTQTRILRRVADTLIVVVAIGAVLMTFESVRQYGISLLASAGAAGIIIGLALQTVLKNLFAGIQLAITQPIRIDDVVIVEGEWGNIEEITSTYVVVRIWDLRRLIVPLSYFIEQPFQNWTHDNAAIMGTVTMSLDYTTPVAEVRRKAKEIVEGTPLWDKRAFSVQVTGFAEKAMQVRVLGSARDAGDAWNLRCLIREELVTWLQAEYPESLPKTRVDVTGDRLKAADRAPLP